MLSWIVLSTATDCCRFTCEKAEALILTVLDARATVMRWGGEIEVQLTLELMIRR